MIDEIVEAALDVVLGFVPNAVWGFLLLLGGSAATAIGIVIFRESARMGGILVTVGVLLVAGVLVAWRR